MNYSQSDIDFMRKDALRRTQEMHSAAKQEKNGVQAGNTPHIEKEHNQTHKGNMQKNNSNPLNGLLSGLFSQGKMDNDKMIIIFLIVMLAREGADLKLLAALGYILM
ncbi:MAG: hypothetical protein ACI4JB_05125 [Porcipelethomonas sp.]